MVLPTMMGDLRTLVCTGIRVDDAPGWCCSICWVENLEIEIRTTAVMRRRDCTKSIVLTVEYGGVGGCSWLGERHSLVWVEGGSR
jgi:hypothetical protein